MKKYHTFLSCTMLSLSAASIAEESLVNQLSTNVSYEFENYITAFKEDITSSTKPIESNTAELWGRLTAQSNASLSKSLILNVEGNLSYSTYEHMNKGVFREPHTKEQYPAFIDLDMLTITQENEDSDVVIGKDFIDLGLSEIYSPTNRFGLANVVNPQHPKEMGLLQARYRTYIEDDALTLLLIPLEERAPAPDASSRWLGATGDADFVKIPSLPSGASFKDDFHARNFKNAGYVVLYEGIREGYDFFTFLNHGPSVYPVLVRNDLVFTKEYPLATSIGGAISAVKDEWKLYSEAVYQHTDNNNDQDFIKYVLGASYRDTEFANKIGIDELQPIIEYADEEVLDEQHNSKYFSDSKNARPFRGSVLAQLQITIDDEWFASIHGNKNFDDKDYSFGALVKYSFDDNLKYYLSSMFYHGADDTAYGRWKENDNIELGFNYKF